MVSQGRPVLGILELDEGIACGSPDLLPRKDALTNPETFDGAIVTEMVEGAFADTIIRGDPSLEGACVAAARKLIERGASVISADCGFFIRHQKAVARAVSVPVALSSLLLVTTLLRQIPISQKLAVITANSHHCTKDLLGLEDPADHPRVVIGGIEGGEYVRNALARPYIRTSTEQIEREVSDCITELRSRHPEVAVLLFECTGFPVVTKALRRRIGLPIYDIADLCRLTLSSLGHWENQ